MPNYKLSSENAINHKKLMTFWQDKGHFGSFQGKGNISIRYAYFKSSQNERAIVISPGRIEAQIKYQELAFDLFRNGYDVFILDHRGQGLSGRMTDNPEVGYVEDFDDYVQDFHHFYQHIVDKNAAKERSLLCHSMGAAIGLQYLIQYPENFSSAALSAPMLGFKTKGVPVAWLILLARMWRRLNLIVSNQPVYFPGQFDYERVNFALNHLTNSDSRYQHFRDLYDQYPDLKLGGVSTEWILAAINAMQYLFDNAQRLKMPILMLQAEKEKVVSNSHQNDFFEQLKKSSPTSQFSVVKDAKHEILIEQDHIRNPAIAKILDFFAASHVSQSTEGLGE